MTLVGLEQTAQDGGKWEVGWLLALQEDPPWATTALAYLKEADVIQSHRQEAIPNRKPAGNPSEKAEAAPKRRNQRYPKKPKEENKK